jgi:Winged helix DNA-binding domain
VARNHLEQRAPRRKLLDVVSDAGAIQAQVQSAAELSLWARVEGLTPDDVRDALWKRRSLVRTWSLRGTLHLHRSTELPLYVAALSQNRRWWTGAWLKYVGLDAAGLEELLKAIRAALTERPMTREELAAKIERRVGPRVRKEMASGWGTLLKPAAFQGALVSGPPQGQNVTFVRPDRWLRGWKRVDGEEAMGEVYRRYLRTFGPATHLDFAAWWGDQPGRFKATRVRLEEEELEQVSIEGTTAWAVSSDVRRMARMEPSTSVRLLPNFDAYVMGFRPREHFHDGRVTARIFRTAGWISPVVLIGGRAEGVWGYERASRGVEVTVEPFGKLPAATKKAVAEEVDRLGRFLAAPARVRYA